MDLDYIQNKTFDEITIGDSASLSKTLTSDDIKTFAIMSGDFNPTHIDPEYAESFAFKEIIAHGMWPSVFITTILGSDLPGPGTIYIDQSIHFVSPVKLGDTITVTVTVTEKNDKNHHIFFDCVCINQHGESVISGKAEVKAPTLKVKRLRVELPEIRLAQTKQARYEHLLERNQNLAPIRMAVVHPCDKESLGGALMARDENLILPVLIGPKDKILDLVNEYDFDLTDCELIDVPHSHAAAELAVQMAKDGHVEALMKGSLHTDELMSEVVKKDGLRTNRRISHVFLMDVPTYPKPLLITDAAVNVDPTLEIKADICQNAIDLARILGTEQPKVAILAAVETINSKMQATLDAAALCKMADRGQIKHGLLDGPLAFDNAISLKAAQTKGINSPVAGFADILLMPDIESGNMVAKQLEYLADALAAGIILGAKVPIVLTSRADTARTRTVSTAVAVIIAHHKRNLKRV